MASNVEIKATITAEDKASAALGNVGTSFGKLTASVAAGQLAFKAANFVWDQFTNAIGGSLKAWETQELAITRLQTGINNVRSATDKHIDSLVRQAQALQKTTRFSDEAVESAQGILSTFQLNQKAIATLTPRLIDMSEGLARVTGEMPDLEGNAILVAKAIGGEDVAGLSGALRRAGVVLTATETQLLKTGTQEQRVAVVTEALDNNFKNMGTQAGQTTAGKIAILKNNFNELQESAGKLMAEALTPLLNVLNKHPDILNAVVIGIGALVASLVALKIAAGISAIVSGLGTAIAFVGTTSVAAAANMATLATFISGPGLLAIAPFALALGTIAGAYWAITNAANATKQALDNTQQSIDKASTSDDAAIKNIEDAFNKGKITKAQEMAAINSIAGRRATGGPINAGSPYLVGEHGPEIVVPNQSGTVVPNNKVGGTVNISVNVGVFAGSQMELRKLATKLQNAYQDAQAMGTA